MPTIRVSVTWELPISRRDYEEIGKAIVLLSQLSKELRLDYADAEGLVFKLEPFDFYSAWFRLQGLIDEVRSVEVLVEEVDDGHQG